MANTLTDLQGEIYAAIDVVSREPVGFLPSVQLNGEASMAQYGKSVAVPVTGATTGADISAGMTIDEPGDKTVTSRDITISKQRRYSFGVTGEEAGGLNTGMGFPSWQSAEIGQAIRGLINEMEADCAAVAINASRAYGTAGTTPFASDLSSMSQVHKILQDNGAPVGAGWNLVCNTAAGANLRDMALFTQANTAGTTQYRDQGSFAEVFGGRIRESGQLGTQTKGTGTSYTSHADGFAVGATTIELITGSGTVLAGDVITFAGDSNKYVVKTGTAAAGDIVLREPGLLQALPASAVAMTIGATYVPNVAFTPDAIQLAARLPYVPPGGDAAVDRMIVVDPFSGIPYEFTIWAGERKVRYDVAAVWGVAMTKEEHAAIMLG